MTTTNGTSIVQANGPRVRIVHGAEMRCKAWGATDTFEFFWTVAPGSTKTSRKSKFFCHSMAEYGYFGDKYWRQYEAAIAPLSPKTANCPNVVGRATTLYSECIAVVIYTQ